MPMRGRVVKRVFEKAPKGDVYQGLVRKVRWGRTYEYKLIKRAHWVEPEVLDKILDELTKVKVVTPTYLANKFNIKVSTSRRLLEALRGEGILELERDISDNKFKVYKLVGKIS
jgi:ribosomal protein S25